MVKPIHDTAVTVCSAISICGDLLVLSTVLLSQAARRLHTARLLAAFALANLIGMVLQLPREPVCDLKAGTNTSVAEGRTESEASCWLCTAQATVLWAVTHSSWLWCGAYARVALISVQAATTSTVPMHRTHYVTAICCGLPMVCRHNCTCI